MKICVIGNSHVGSLKQTWSHLKEEYSHTRMVFFAAPRDMLKSLTSDGTRLLTNYEGLRSMMSYTSGGSDTIVPDAYDRFLIYGANLSPWFEPKGFYSRAVMEQSVRDHVESSLSFRILDLLRGITDKAVTVGHDPLPAPKGADPGDNDENVPTRSYVEGVRQMNRLVLSHHDAVVHLQPLDTIVGGRFTHSSFGKGSKRLDTGPEKVEELHPKWDRTHMNEAFGRMWIKAYFDDIAAP